MPRSKTRGPAKLDTLRQTGTSAPASAVGDRSAVSGPTLLRLRRPDAGQVRDAAPGSHRQGFHQRVRAGLRFLPPIVLSGAGRVAAERRVRLASAQTRPARRAQTDHPGDGVCRRAAIRRFFANPRATCRSHPAAVPDSGPSAEHSAAVAAAKKTTLKPSFAGGSSAALRSSYEDLRAQVLAGSRGPGFALFLHHGMCEWLEVCSSCTAVVAATQPVAATATPNFQMLPPGMRSEIVAILAGIFLEKQWEAAQ